MLRFGKKNLRFVLARQAEIGVKACLASDVGFGVDVNCAKERSWFPLSAGGLCDPCRPLAQRFDVDCSQWNHGIAGSVDGLDQPNKERALVMLKWISTFFGPITLGMRREFVGIELFLFSSANRIVELEVRSLT